MQKNKIFSIIIMENYDDAYKEVVKRLRQAELIKVTIPCRNCTSAHRCKKPTTALVPKITEYCVAPVAIFEECHNDLLKKTTKKALQKTTKKAPPLEYVFLTINPKPSISFSEFKDRFLRLLKSKLFASHSAVLEQRGTEQKNNIGHGFHAHILFKRYTPLNEGLAPFNIKRNLKDSWRPLCDVDNDQIFNIQFIGHEFAQDKLSYMHHEKGTKEKQEKQLGDAIWRDLHDLQTKYEKL